MYTVWKFHKFTITQILHEINFEDSKSAKSAIFTQLEDLNCVKMADSVKTYASNQMSLPYQNIFAKNIPHMSFLDID